MNVLIAGGAGFLGSHLVELFLKKGYEVFAVDNLSTGSIQNIKAFDYNSKFSFIKHDIVQPIDINSKIDLILHFASPASPIHYQKISIETYLVNSLGTYNLLELAVKKNARFIFASTSEAYGDPKEHPQREIYWGNVNPIGVRSCYDESKRFGEGLSMEYHRKYGLDVRVLRIFNTYGPHMAYDDGRVVSNFICQALANKPITIYGSGMQTRSFCYVTDLVEGIWRASQIENINGEIINLGNTQEITVLELAQQILEICGSNNKLVFKELPYDDPVRRKPDITKAINLLGWSPKTPLQRGIKNSIDYFSKVLSKDVYKKLDGKILKSLKI